MSKTITLRDANQGFSRCIREVEAGEEFVITRNGKPVAKLTRVDGKRVLTPEQEAALARLASTSWPLGTEQFSREDIYQEKVDRHRGS